MYIHCLTYVYYDFVVVLYNLISVTHDLQHFSIVYLVEVELGTIERLIEPVHRLWRSTVFGSFHV